MSRLRERLLRHHKHTDTSLKQEDQDGWVADVAGGESIKLDEAMEMSAIGAHMEINEWGSFIMRRRVYESGSSHGQYILSDLVGKAGLLQPLLPANDDHVGGNASLSHEQLLYLDIETTGLGIGAGNVAFMIGIGFYEGTSFIVEQMFIRDPGEELSMLRYLKQKVEQRAYLVTYNGKSFDWPIIKSRYIMNRIRPEITIAGHFDFLYPSRSLWKHTLPSCRLGKVEEERLGVLRKDDVPGSLAPVLYFQYLAEREISIVEGAFIHNELDICSLAGLSVHFAKLLGGEVCLQDMGLEELYRLGLWLNKLQQSEWSAKALAVLEERIYDPAACQESTASYMLKLATLYKQQQRYTAAKDLWELYIERKGDRAIAAVEPFIELSMHYEHRDKHYVLALTYARRGLDQLWRLQSLKRAFKSPIDNPGILEKRIQRLRQKIAKTQDRAASALKPKRRRGSSSRNVGSKLLF